MDINTYSLDNKDKHQSQWLFSLVQWQRGIFIFLYQISLRLELKDKNGVIYILFSYCQQSTHYFFMSKSSIVVQCVLLTRQ